MKLIERKIKGVLWLIPEEILNNIISRIIIRRIADNVSEIHNLDDNSFIQVEIPLPTLIEWVNQLDERILTILLDIGFDFSNKKAVKISFEKRRKPFWKRIFC